MDLQNANTINFTGNRHHVSTYFASLGLSQNEKVHSSTIWVILRITTSARPAVRTITTVGKRLLQMEGMLCYQLYCYFIL